MLERGLIPPSINFKKGNPKIKFDEWKLRVPTALAPWPIADDHVRRISINSFGYGGTNAHAILDDAYHYLTRRGISATHYTDIAPTKSLSNGLSVTKINGSHALGRPGPRLFVWSAQDKDGLGRVKELLARYVREKTAEHDAQPKNDEEFMLELAYTLAEREITPPMEDIYDCHVSGAALRGSRFQ